MSFYKEVPGRQTTLESTLKFDTEPRAGSTNPVTSDGVLKSNEAIFDDGDPGMEDEEVTGSEYYSSHEVGKFYFEQGTLWKCINKTREGEPGSYTYTTQMSKMNGVVNVVNDIVDRIVEANNKMQVIAAALDDLDARLKAVEESISSVNIGSRVADELDAQSLKVGGEDINTVIQNAIGG